MREIWELQPRLAKTQSRRCVELLTHPRFRAAYDFVLLREQSGENLNGIGKFWTDLQEQHPGLVGSRPARAGDDEQPASDDYNDAPRKRRRRAPRNRNRRSEERRVGKECRARGGAD